MNDFDLQSHLNSVYATFPEATNRPVIGITSNYTNGDAALRDRYYTQVVAAGGTPVIIPPVANKDVIIGTLDRIDGLLLTGGGDYNPLWAGEEPLPQLHGINSERDLPELLLTRLAFNRQIPMLGICRGIQTLALALGGTLMQDIAQGMPAAARLLKHSQEADRQEPTHSVSIEPDSILYGIYGTRRLYVNSFHHQAVQDPGKRFRVTAQAPDGVAEAIESTEFKSVLGVQWHPEWLQQEGLKLFEWLVGQAGNFSLAKRLHDRVLTLDTHCDTPMFFPQGVNFAQRDPRILVDLHKMADGRQDAVTMVAYLPQPGPGEQFAEKIDIDGLQKYNPQQASLLSHITPTAYADFIFDKIEATVNEHAHSVAIARTPAQLYDNKRHGRKSVMLGIENGLALGNDLSAVSHFAQRGVVYITLCHNGDNQICDSARGSGTHGGVSAFGEQVIREMNAQGIMVDLSHGAESSFFDALDISLSPIVCSHSNCRALCNVPRNLTDQQLRALARKGGVAHTTLYAGFLRQAGEADIRDAVAHLEHAISVMGIDHVGLGTDFDGDGGILGLADSSELINFTICLLRRKYSEQDIAQIWGGNWLRVMSQVQNARK